MRRQAGLRRLGSFEQAVAAVRLMLAALYAAVVAGDRLSPGLDGIERSTTEALLAVGLAAAVSAWTLVGPSRPGASGEPRYSVHLVHLLDTAGAVGLVASLGPSLPRSGWGLLVVPVVIASVRFPSPGVLLTGIGSVAGYAAAARLAPERFDLAGADLVRQAGVLLSVTAAIAIVSRWLSEGWVAQAELSERSQLELDRLATLQAAGGAMQIAGPDDIPAAAGAHLVSLGFDAAVVVADGMYRDVAGDGELIPIGVDPPVAQSDKVTVTEWIGEDDERCFSAALLEPRTGWTFAGWSRSPISDELARSAAWLIERCTQALEAAGHLERARQQALRDPLTRALTRTALQLYLHSEGPFPSAFLGVVFIDLDRFAVLNQTHGRTAGDQVLQSVADRLLDEAGSRGVTVRFGGDEFVVLLRATDPTEVLAIADQICARLSEPHQVPGRAVRSSASVGVSFGGAADRHLLVEWAGEAAQWAGRAGGNRVAVGRRRDPPGSYPSAAAGMTASPARR